MLLNRPRYTPRLVATVAAAFALCFWFQYHLNVTPAPPLWTVTSSAFEKSVQHRERFNEFFNRLYNYRPSHESLDIPDGLDIYRVEDVTPEWEGLDKLSISDADFNASAAAHAQVVRLLPEYKNVVKFAPGSKGIVTVGGGSYTPALLVSIRMMRKTNCTLPIEVFIPQENEYDPYSCDVVLAALDARCILLPRFNNVTIDHYAFKSVALLTTSFENVLFLDADNFPLVDPTPWFTSEPYLSTGLVTWPDFWAITTSPVYWRLTGQDPMGYLERASTEAGSMLISRKHHATTLLLAFYYNLFGPDFYYLLISQHGIGGEGDKDTWLAAARALSLPHYQVKERNHGLVKGDDESSLDDIVSMIQFDPVEDYKLEQANASFWRNRPEAKIVFLHCNRVKLNPSAVLGRLEEIYGNNQQRMFGSKEKTMGLFGRDVEKEVWEEIIHVACKNGRTMIDIEDGDRETVCGDVRRFWWGIAAQEEVEERVHRSREEDLVEEAAKLRSEAQKDGPRTGAEMA